MLSDSERADSEITAAAGFTDPAEHTLEQAAAFVPRVKLIEELETRTLSSSAPRCGRSRAPQYVVTSRGGSYAPGTPREGYAYVQNYLRAVLGDMLGMEVDFIVAELTMAHSNPARAELISFAEASRAKAHEDAISKGKEAARNAAA